MISGSRFHVPLCQSPPLMQRLAERFRTEHASLPFSLLKTGASWLGVWGKGKEGTEGMAPATHHSIPEFWLKRKILALTFSICKIQMYFDFLKEPKAQVSQERSYSELLTQNLKLLGVSGVECTASALSKVTLRWLGVAQQHDVSLLRGAELLSNATWTRVVTHRNLANSSKNFISLKVFNIFLYVLWPRLSKSLISLIFSRNLPWITGQAVHFQLNS